MPADGAVMAGQDLEHVVQRRFEVQRARQRLADFEQRREAADFGRLAFARRGLARFQRGAAAHWLALQQCLVINNIDIYVLTQMGPG